MSDDRLAEIVSRLKESRKYRYLCEDTLRRIALWAAARHSNAKVGAKVAKRKLHQVFGAYCAESDWAKLDALVGALAPHPAADVLHETCRHVLELHASTRERVPFMEEAYAEIFRRAGPAEVVLDLACGLNPFALPWMGLSANVSYHACDIDRRIVSAVNALLSRVGVGGNAVCSDVLLSVPDVAADVALLLKTVPCLERQERDAGIEVLRRVNARNIVVSFPARSLGGSDKGMHVHYAAGMTELADALDAGVEELAYPNETFYVLTRA